MAARQVPITVWYDGACPLCLREIALMRRLDRGGRIDFVDVSGAGPGDGAPAGCPIDRARLLERFHAREGEVIHVGAAACAAMWRAIPLLRPLGLAARLPGVLPLLDALYGRFLKVRPRLAKLVAR